MSSVLPSDGRRLVLPFDDLSSELSAPANDPLLSAPILLPARLLAGDNWGGAAC